MCVVIFVVVLPTSSRPPTPTLKQALTAAFAFTQQQDLPSAASAYDHALLHHQVLRTDLPPTIGPILQAAGRAHFDLSVTSPDPNERHLRTALTYFSASVQLQPPTTKDYNLLSKALISIYTKLKQYERAELVFVNITTSQDPELLYDYAVWIMKHRATATAHNVTVTTSTTFTKPIHLLQRAAKEFQRRNLSPYTLHSSLPKSFYLLGLILHEWGKQASTTTVWPVETIHQKIYIKHGSTLWKDSHRRFLTPRDHPEFVSVPFVATDHHWYPTKDVHWLQTHFSTIQQEVIASTSSTNQYTMEQEHLHTSSSMHRTHTTHATHATHTHTAPGNWTMLRFTNDGVLNQHTCALLPQTCNVLTAMPSLQRCLHVGCSEIFVYVSKLSPGTDIPKHCGPTWKRLRIHVALQVPTPSDECCWLNVLETTATAAAGTSTDTYQKIQWKEGEIFVFDDSYEHSVQWGNGSSDRIVLIVDVYHPAYMEMLQQQQERQQQQHAGGGLVDL